MEESRDGAVAIGARLVRTDHVVVGYPPASYAERVADGFAERAELTYNQAWEWFGRAGLAPPIVRLELCDGDAASAEAIGVSPEQPTRVIERRVLENVAQGCGVDPEAPVLEWLANYLAMRHGVPPSLAEADHVAQARLPLGPGDLQPEGQISLLAYLQRMYGATALARFARAAVAAPGDVALAQTYGRPAADVLQAWHADLARMHASGNPAVALVRSLAPLLKPHALRYLELTVLVLLDLGAVMVMPLATKVLIDSILPERDLRGLTIWLIVVPVSFVVGALAAYRRTVAAGVIGELLQRDLMRVVFAHLQRLSLAFHHRARSGDLMSRITNDVGQVKSIVGETLPQLIYNLAMLVVSTIALLLLNWLLGLIVLIVAIPVFSVIYARTSQSVMNASRDLQTAFGDASASLSENLSAQGVVKAFSLEEHSRRGFDSHLEAIFVHSLRAIRLGAMLTGSTTLIFNALRVTVLAGGAVLVFVDRMTIGELVALLWLVGQVLQPVMIVTGQYRRLLTASAAFDRVRELLEEAPEVVEDPAAVELPRPDREIRLERVTLRYGQAAEAALRDVSLSIPIGAHVALVGPSGSGKSSLASLLLRLYDPQHGRILVDDRDIREMTLASLRGQFGVVPQDTFLFDAPIYDNIALGSPDAGRADVERAARAAAVEDAILQTANGYQTVVGERGVRLSGGQRQRLAIARALVRDPAILLLDEATSNLDPETETAILGTLDNAASSTTRIVITHRLSAAVRADVIFVLERGRLVEQGTHTELLAQRGVYWRMYAEQAASRERSEPRGVDPALVADVPLMGSLSETDLAEFARRFSVESYPAETLVVRQGDPADRLYVIGSGSVEVLVDERRVRVMGGHSYFGEIALLDGGDQRRSATVRTLAPTELYSLHREDFLELLHGRPKLAEAVRRLAALRRRHD